MRLIFHPQGWEDYLHWQTTDRKLLVKLNALITACSREPFSGIGKPEPLRGKLSGLWSRRLTLEHRLIYRVESDALHVMQCRYHYE